MRILCTFDFPPEPGGIQNYLSGIVHHTYTRNDLVITLRHPDATMANDTAWPCPVVRVGPSLRSVNKKLALFFMVLRLLKVCRGRTSGSMVECGNVYAAIAPFLLHLVRGTPYMVYNHGTELLPLQRRSIRAVLLRTVLAHAQSLTVVTGYTAQLLRDGNIVREFIHVPPRIELAPGLLDRSAQRTARSSFTEDNPARLLCIGRLMPHKGHHVLLEALSLVPHRYHWTCTIAGNGPCEQELRDLCERSSLATRVTIATNLNDRQLQEELDIADLFILPSLQIPGGTEGFGIVLLEAMAHGVPIVASRAGGIPEVLDNGGCATLVESGDHHLLSEVLQRVLDNPALRADHARRGLERVRTTYAW